MTSFAIDNFTRGNQAGFGTSSGGDVWAATGSDTPSIASNAGLVTATSGAHVELEYLGSNTIQDALAKAKFQGSATAHDYAVMLRGNGSTTYYMAEMNAGSFEILKVVANVVTNLATCTLTFNAATNYWILLQAMGTNPTWLGATFWADGSTQPGFQLLIQDNTASANLQAAGQFGIRTKLGSTDTAHFYAFEVDAVSQMHINTSSGLGGVYS